MAKIFIETERLILREIIPEDAEAFFAIDSNPEVVKYIGIKPRKIMFRGKEPFINEGENWFCYEFKKTIL